MQRLKNEAENYEQAAYDHFEKSEDGNPEVRRQWYEDARFLDGVRAGLSRAVRILKDHGL
jgi:hypothetical protein